MLFADSPEACPYGFHRFVIFDQTYKPQFEHFPITNRAPPYYSRNPRIFQDLTETFCSCLARILRQLRKP